MKILLYATSFIATMIAGVQAASIDTLAQLDAQPNPLTAPSIESLAQLDAQPNPLTAASIDGLAQLDTRGIGSVWKQLTGEVDSSDRQDVLYEGYKALHHSLFENPQILDGRECAYANAGTMSRVSERAQREHRQRIAHDIERDSDRLADTVTWIKRGSKKNELSETEIPIKHTEL